LENRRVLVDTSILIDFFRRENKKKSLLYRIRQTHEIYTSSISEFEFLAGVKCKGPCKREVLTGADRT
jgi:predicted nucleic acid-binding protein